MDAAPPPDSVRGMVEVYFLISAAAGAARGIVEAAAGLRGVLSAEAVTGPYDVIVGARGRSLSEIQENVLGPLAALDGVGRVLTCPVAHPEVLVGA
jgi:DNA-binding Lrp family transcriptional regulator